jgi:protoporphyrinogen/coproporphyrinogen III oxidase
MALFCGYGEDDFSLAWTLWGASGRYAWANSWWTFIERGVGRLTWELGGHLAQDAHVDYRLGTEASNLRYDAGGISVEIHGQRGAELIHAEAAVVAVPGSNARCQE